MNTIYDFSAYTNMELVQIQNYLRQFTEDKEMLCAILEELQKRHAILVAEIQEKLGL